MDQPSAEGFRRALEERIRCLKIDIALENRVTPDSNYLMTLGANLTLTQEILEEFNGFYA